jgi:hypothetical protein
MGQVRLRNARLAAVIAETGWSHAQVANAFVRVASENGARELAGVDRSHVSHWVGGSHPSGCAPVILCEALSRRLGRTVTLDEVGLTVLVRRAVVDWRVDTLIALTDLRKVDIDMERKRVLVAATYGDRHAPCFPVGLPVVATRQRATPPDSARSGLVSTS